MKPTLVQQNQQKILYELDLAKIDRRQLATDLLEHTKQDTSRFDAMTETLKTIQVDMRSLLDTREAARGAWKLLAIIGTFCLGFGAIVTAYFHK